jgi:hypothetical protein
MSYNVLIGILSGENSFFWHYTSRIMDFIHDEILIERR